MGGEFNARPSKVATSLESRLEVNAPRQALITTLLRGERQLRGWSKFSSFDTGREGYVGVTARDNRLFVEAVLWRYRSGSAWRDLPERFGHFRKVHTRFSRWCRAGVWRRVFEHLAADADNEYAMIDATIVRAHQHSAGAKKRGARDQALGRSRGGMSTKIHTRVDALGNPTDFHLTPGQAHDLEGADALLPGCKAACVIGDRAFDAQARLIEPLLAAAKTVVIPLRSTRKYQRDYDCHLYKARHLIENFFAKLKQYRAVATRYSWAPST